jgi:hypothetical protein
VPAVRIRNHAGREGLPNFMLPKDQQHAELESNVDLTLLILLHNIFITAANKAGKLFKQRSNTNHAISTEVVQIWTET